MKVRYRKGVATHLGPESCGGVREDDFEALTGETAGQPLSRVRNSIRVPTPLGFSLVPGSVGVSRITQLAPAEQRALLRGLGRWKHRLYTGRDVALLLSGARALQREHGSLGAAFASFYRSQEGELREAASAFVRAHPVPGDGKPPAVEPGKETPRYSTVVNTRRPPQMASQRLRKHT